MRKSVINILLIILVTFLSIFTLQFLTSDHNQNGFNRNMRLLKMTVEKVYQLPASLYYFAGVSDDQIYFQDFNTNELGMIDFALVQYKKIDLKLSPELKRKRLKIGVTDSSIYLVDIQSGMLTLISKALINSNILKNPRVNMKHAVLISDHSLIGNSFTMNGNELQRELTKINSLTGKTEKHYVLNKQKDSFFSNDGALNFSSRDNKLFYMYYYRGAFICLDTNFTLHYKTKTIDTINIANVNITKSDKSTIKKKNITWNQTSPPKVVNRNFVLDDDKIYIMSALRADNEETSGSKNNQVIDVYSQNDGKYHYSFYIPKYNGRKLHEFRIIKDTIFAVFDNIIVKFHLENSLLNR